MRYKTTKNMFRILLSRLSHKFPDQSMMFPVSRLSMESYDVENQKWCDEAQPVIQSQTVKDTKPTYKNNLDDT